MAKILPYTLINGELKNISEANLSVASSAVLYGLSVYSVFYAQKTPAGLLIFRLKEHLERLRQSSQLIGLGFNADLLNDEAFIHSLKELFAANQAETDCFVRITVHASELVPGVKTSGMELALSVFMYEAQNILPQDQARIKTSLWRRTTDTSIPARAKVNGAYVNSALAKQEAIDTGFDDCLFLNHHGFVSELTAANIFMVKNGTLVTPDSSSDILEGITRRSVMELAKQNNIPVTERKVALTELYTADEVFACGTSAFVSPITEIDGRKIKTGKPGSLTTELRELLRKEQSNPESDWTTLIN